MTPPADLDPVHARRHDSQQDDVGLHLVRPVDGSAIDGGVHLVAFIFQGRLDEGEERGIVIHHEHAALA